MPFMFDSYYFILIIPALIFTLIAQAKVNSTYKKYAQVQARCGKTASQVCREILNSNGLTDVAIGHVAGNLTDHYDPKTNTINLSDTTYDSTSVAAIGVAAHEAGHACQYGESYFPVKLRTAIVPATRFASMAAPWILIIGVFLGYGARGYGSSTLGNTLIDFAIILFGLAVVFQLVTLPVEYNASHRALKTLSHNGILMEDEVQDTKQVLNAAALTYVAALAAALASFLRIILLFGGNRRRR